MNELQKQIQEANLTQVGAMNLLQGSGVISDNCIALEDIAAPDDTRAAEWIKGWRQSKKEHAENVKQTA